MQTIQQTNCNISTPDLSLHLLAPYPLCLSGFREVKSEEFLAICLLISFVLNQLAIEGKTSLRYRENDGTGRESGLNRTSKMRGLEELAETDEVLTMPRLARQHNLTIFQNIGKR